MSDQNTDPNPIPTDQPVEPDIVSEPEDEPDPPSPDYDPDDPDPDSDEDQSDEGDGTLPRLVTIEMVQALFASTLASLPLPTRPKPRKRKALPRPPRKDDPPDPDSPNALDPVPDAGSSDPNSSPKPRRRRRPRQTGFSLPASNLQTAGSRRDKIAANRFRKAQLAHLNPRDATEAYLAERIVFHRWILLKCDQAELALLRTAPEEPTPSPPASPDPAQLPSEFETLAFGLLDIHRRQLHGPDLNQVASFTSPKGELIWQYRTEHEQALERAEQRFHDYRRRHALIGQPPPDPPAPGPKPTPPPETPSNPAPAPPATAQPAPSPGKTPDSQFSPGTPGLNSSITPLTDPAPRTPETIKPSADRELQPAPSVPKRTKARATRRNLRQKLFNRVTKQRKTAPKNAPRTPLHLSKPITGPHHRRRKAPRTRRE